MLLLEVIEARDSKDSTPNPVSVGRLQKKLAGHRDPCSRLSWMEIQPIAFPQDLPFGERNMLAFVPGLHMVLPLSGYSVSLYLSFRAPSNPFPARYDIIPQMPLSLTKTTTFGPLGDALEQPSRELVSRYMAAEVIFNSHSLLRVLRCLGN